MYVIPVLPFSDVWYSRPNSAIDPILQVPTYPSGPGFAYGYGFNPSDIATQLFATGSVLSVTFTAGLKRWDGTTFADAGDTQLKAFRGSDPAIDSPAASFAITSDIGPYDSVSLAAVQESYGNDDEEIHASLRFALLGDGSSPTSASPDGVYLLSMQLSSTQPGLNPSDEYYFVLNKNASWPTVQSAVNSLGIAGSLQQWSVPEPAAGLLCAVGLAANFAILYRKRRDR